MLFVLKCFVALRSTKKALNFFKNTAKRCHFYKIVRCHGHLPLEQARVEYNTTAKMSNKFCNFCQKNLLVELCLPPCCQQATQMVFLTSNLLPICTHAVCAFATQCSCWRILPFLHLQLQFFFKQKHVSLEKRHSM